MKSIRLTHLELTGSLRARAAAVRQVAPRVEQGALPYSALELVKLELADDVLRAIDVQASRLARLPHRTSTRAAAALVVRGTRVRRG